MDELRIISADPSARHATSCADAGTRLGPRRQHATSRAMSGGQLHLISRSQNAGSMARIASL